MGKPAIERMSEEPQIRLGSLWFRVLSPRGIKVRLGPSRRATSIKSEDDVYFRFECGEFLRASEVVAYRGSACDSFAKLYRHRHLKLHGDSGAYRSLPSLTAPAEWVQVMADDYRYLQECAEPQIQRHRDGWRYNVVRESGVAVRKGPSFAADVTNIQLLAGESLLVNERVAPPSEPIVWLRLKDGHGWVHDVAEDGEQIMVAHSLWHRTRGTLKSKKEEDEAGDQAYKAIVARLFKNKEEEGQDGQEE